MTARLKEGSAIALVLALAAALVFWFLSRPPGSVAEIATESVQRGADVEGAAEAIEDIAALPLEREAADAPGGAASEALAMAPSTPAFPLRPAAETGSLDLRISWSDGTPAAEVSANLFPFGDSSPRKRSQRVTTDESGRVLVLDLSPGRVAVIPDRAQGNSFDVEAGSVTVAEMTIAEGFEVAGVVKDPEGRPIAAAEIVLSDYANDGEAKFVGVTDEAGAYRVRDVGEARSLSARAAGFAPSLPELLTGHAPGEAYSRDFVLQPNGATLFGRVEDESGVAVAGARIRIQPAGSKMSQGRRLKPHPVEFVSAEDGSFESGVIGAEHVTVYVRTEMHAPLSQWFKLEPGERQEVTLVLRMGAILEGTVLRADGSPAVGATVSTGTGDRRWTFLGGSTPVDGRGRYKRQGIDPRHVQAVASEAEYGKVEETVALTAGEVTRWDVRLEAGRTVVGRVVDERGAGLSGWMVGTQSQQNLWDRRTDSAADGAFTLRDVREDARVLHVTVPGGWSVGTVATEPIPLLSEAAAPVVIRVPDAVRPSSRLRLRVLANGVAPSPPAQVYVRLGGGFSDAFTDEDGEVDMPYMRPGTAHVSVTLDGYASHYRDVDIPGDATVDAGTVRLTRGGRIAVEYQRGEGYDELRLPRQVSIYSESGKSLAYFDLEDGKALSPPLEPGTYRFRPNTNVLATPSELVQVAEGETTDATFTLIPGGATRLMIRMADGLDVPESLSLNVSGKDGSAVLRYGSLLHLQEGPLIPLYLTGLPGGTLTVEVGAPGGQSGTANVEITHFGDGTPPVGAELTLR